MRPDDTVIQIRHFHIYQIAAANKHVFHVKGFNLAVFQMELYAFQRSIISESTRCYAGDLLCFDNRKEPCLIFVFEYQLAGNDNFFNPFFNAGDTDTFDDCIVSQCDFIRLIFEDERIRRAFEDSIFLYITRTELQAFRNIFNTPQIGYHLGTACFTRQEGICHHSVQRQIICRH